MNHEIITIALGNFGCHLVLRNEVKKLYNNFEVVLRSGRANVTSNMGVESGKGTR